MVWYDAEGRDPTWFPEELEKIRSRRCVYHGSSTHYMNVHIEVSARARVGARARAS